MELARNYIKSREISEISEFYGLKKKIQNFTVFLYWGAVKIEYSPPTPDAFPESPHYITNRRIAVVGKGRKKVDLPSNEFRIMGLRQGQVYTRSQIVECFSESVKSVKRKKFFSGC